MNILSIIKFFRQKLQEILGKSEKKEKSNKSPPKGGAEPKRFTNSGFAE